MLIRLKNYTWEFDETSGIGKAGGFGAVFHGKGDSHGPVAIKQIKFERGTVAKREIDVASFLIGKMLPHVIPVYDAGYDEDSEHYYLVMACAGKDLHKHVQESGPLSDDETCQILLDVANGLASVSTLVHRDLKPQNILSHEGRWKLADFGISKFVEETTSTNTLRNWLSPAYASPEQLDGGVLSNSTDIYSLGCIGYYLKTGSPPFGIGRDVKERHLQDSPPKIQNTAPQIQAILSKMLLKSPKTRIGIQEVIRLLQTFKDQKTVLDPSSNLNRIAKVGAEALERAAVMESEEARDSRLKREREIIASEARQMFFDEIAASLIEHISRASPAIVQSSKGFSVSLNGASLMVDVNSTPVPRMAFSRSNWDVVLRGWVSVKQTSPQYTWSASLWYADIGNGLECRWYEVGYMMNPLSMRSRPDQPFSLFDNLENADEAAAPGMGLFQFAYRPVPIDNEMLQEFINRWTDKFALACERHLSSPRYLPLDKP